MSTDAPDFRLRALRAIRVEDRIVLRGQQFHATAPDAAAWVRSGDAVLADDRDLPELVRALGLRNGCRVAPAVP